MRLYRPHIPLEVKLRVVLRQLGEMWPEEIIAPAKRERDLGGQLGLYLACLAELLGCNRKDLRLDHDPPLGARPLMHKRKTGTIVYKPDANDPDYLFYRPHGTQFAGSHDVKTRIRGDHGQYSDIVLIKRERRRQQKKRIKRKRKWASRPFPKGKRKIPSRPFRQQQETK